MRSEAEIRAAISTLERAICEMPPESDEFFVMAGEISALRYVLKCETCNPTLAETLAESRAIFAERDLDPQRN